MAADAKSVLKMIKDKEVKFVDLRFTDPRGKWQHVTFDLSLIDEDAFTHGLMFDGSSIAGWKAINESDMTLMPDPSSAVIDPFFAQTTLAIFCDIHEPLTGQPYNRCPRSIAKPITAARITRMAIRAIVRRSRAAISRYRRWIRLRTSARKCSP